MIQNIRIFFCYLFIIFSLKVTGQQINSNELIFPLKDTVGLSGSFGEIRTDHFHSGIDLKTNGKTGFDVFSSSNGYVSRIKVSPVGFGKALYIDHPNGTTTVYAHLKSYSPKIDSIVKNYQYQQKSFEVELFPSPNEIMVSKGELVGISGNSGTSAGPHLHYEVRFTDSQKPINPLNGFINIYDSISPTIRSIHIYKLDSINMLLSQLRKNDLQLNSSIDTFTINGTIGIGIDAFDTIDKLSSFAGITDVQLSVNNEIIYQLSLNEFAFSETKYVNSVIDYRAKIDQSKEIIRLFAEPNNKFSAIKQLKNKGFIKVNQNDLYKIEIKIADASKNIATSSFYIKGSPRNDSIILRNVIDSKVLAFNIDNIIENKFFKLSIPKNTLYSHSPFRYLVSKTNKTKYSSLYSIGIKTVPLHNRIELQIKTPKIPTHLLDKSLIVQINGNGKLYPFISNYKNGSVLAMIPTFGAYFVTVDTVPPSIKPLNFKCGDDLSKIDTIKFIVKDELSGIKTVNGFIDENWALFELDPKNNNVFYEFDLSKIKKSINHTLRLMITDEKGNERKFTCNFYK